MHGIAGLALARARARARVLAFASALAHAPALGSAPAPACDPAMKVAGAPTRDRGWPPQPCVFVSTDESVGKNAGQGLRTQALPTGVGLSFFVSLACCRLLL